MKKKVLSLLLTLCLVMTFVPMAAFAEGTSVEIGTARQTQVGTSAMRQTLNTISPRQSSWRDLQNSQILELILVHLQVIHLRIRLYI